MSAGAELQEGPKTAPFSWRGTDNGPFYIVTPAEADQNHLQTPDPRALFFGVRHLDARSASWLLGRTGRADRWAVVDRLGADQTR
jgi:hypothetical protein